MQMVWALSDGSDHNDQGDDDLGEGYGGKG